jgi:hypothetical protein
MRWSRLPSSLGSGLALWLYRHECVSCPFREGEILFVDGRVGEEGRSCQMPTTSSVPGQAQNSINPETYFQIPSATEPFELPAVPNNQSMAVDLFQRLLLLPQLS